MIDNHNFLEKIDFFLVKLCIKIWVFEVEEHEYEHQNAFYCFKLSQINVSGQFLIICAYCFSDHAEDKVKTVYQAESMT